MVRLAAEAIESEPEQYEDTETFERADSDWRAEDQSDNLAYGRERVVNLPSAPVMTGTHFHSIDDKNRVIIPAKLRPSLTDQFWMMLDDNDNVSIYNYETGLNILANCERLMAEFPDDEELASAVERTTSATDLVTIESGHRVLISEILLSNANLDKEVVTVGVLNHAVIWDRQRWEDNEIRKMESLQSGDVRKRQAALMRAGASQSAPKSRRPEVEGRSEASEDHEIAATGTRGISQLGRRGIARPDERKSAPGKAASAGHDERSSRVLALSKLGRSRS